MIATDKLYELLTHDNYDAAKTAHMSAIAGYAGKSTEEKWTFLLKTLLAPPLVNKQAAGIFKAFCASRLGNGPGTRVSLPDCLSYFESFYFLWVTTTTGYQISPADKAELLKLITEAAGGGICEIGRQARFEWSLQKYRRDLNWVASELSKKRFDWLERLQQAYNAQKKIHDVNKSHTLTFMMRLAYRDNWGLHTESELEDVYLSAGRIVDIEGYFTRHAPGFFAQYEEQAIADLTDYLTDQITSLLRDTFGIHVSRWHSQSLHVPDDRIKGLTAFITNHLQFPPEADTGLHTLMRQNDDGSWTLESRECFCNNLEKLIKRKLIGEGVFIPVSQVNASNLDSLRLKREISTQELFSFHNFIMDYNGDAPHKLSRMVQDNWQLIANYPDILLDHVGKHPLILSVLPEELRDNPFFMDAAVLNLEQQLLKAIKDQAPEQEEQDQQKQDQIIDNLTDCLWAIIQLDPSYINKITSSELLTNRKIARRLVGKDGFLLRKFPALWDDEGIVHAAREQTTFADLYSSLRLQKLGTASAFSSQYQEVYGSLPASLAQNFPRISFEAFEGVEAISKALSDIAKMRTMRELCAPERMNALKVARIVQRLSPSDLMNVVKYRQKNSLPPLPYCDLSILEQFHEDLRPINPASWGDNGHLSMKRRALRAVSDTFYLTKAGLQQHGGEHADAVDHLSQTRYWFVAFIRYRNNYLQPSSKFESWSEVWLQLKSSVDKLISFLFSILKVAFAVFIGFLLVSVIFVVVHDLIPKIGFLGWSALTLGALFLQSWHDNFFTGALYYSGLLALIILSAPLVLLISLVSIVFEEIEKWPPLIKNIFFPWITKTYSTLFSFLQSMNAKDDDLQTTDEDTIIHLQSMTLGFAQEQGELLEKIWDQMEQDHQSVLVSESQLPLAQRKYPVFHKGVTNRLSFAEVVAFKEKDFASSPRFFSKRGAATTVEPIDPEWQGANLDSEGNWVLADDEKQSSFRPTPVF